MNNMNIVIMRIMELTITGITMSALMVLTVVLLPFAILGWLFEYIDSKFGTKE